MTQAIPFDAVLLSEPLAPHAPCGEDLHYDAVYDRIAEMARSEPDGLPMGVWEREIKKADWNGVATLCNEVLTTRSKDLQIAAWFTQAQFELYGLSGGAWGWRIFTDLATVFWDAIYPRIVDGDVEFRLRPVYWLTQCTGTWLTAITLGEEAGRDAKVLHDLSPAEERDALKALSVQIARLQEFFDLHLGEHAPLMHSLRDALRQRLAVLGADDHEAGTDAQASQGESASPLQRRAVNSRDAAYAAIAEIAAYLAKVEPHSPVPMILTAVVDWRDCRFNELLERLPEGKASLYELIKFFGAH